MRCIEEGKCVASILCSVLNLTHLFAKIERLNNSLYEALLSTCWKLMFKALEFSIRRNDNFRDITVALDGN